MSVTAAQLVATVSVTGAQQAKSDLKGVSDAVDQTQGGFKSMLANALSFAAGIGIFNLASQAVGFLKDQFTSTIKAAMDHQLVMAQTAQAIKSTGDASGMSAQAINDLAMSLSRVTTFSADTIQGGENLLLTFTNIGQQVFPQATQAILDVSQAMGQDLKSSAIQIGKALDDPITGITALTRIGVTFSAQEKEQIKTMMAHNDVIGAQKIILGELNKEFGGSAEAAGKTFAGALQIVSNQLDDMKIKIGTALLPVLSQLLSFVSDKILPGLETFGDWFTTKAVPVLQSFSASFSQNVEGTLKQVTDFITGPVAQDFNGLIELVEKVGRSKGFADLVASSQQLAGAIDKIAGPKLEQIGSAFQKLFSDKSITNGALSISNAFELISKAINGVSGFISGLPGMFNTAKAAMAPVVSFLESNFKPAWDQLVVTFNTQLKPAWDDLMKAIKPAMPALQGLAVIVGGVLVGALILAAGTIAGFVEGLAKALPGIIQAFGGVVQTISGILQTAAGIFQFLSDLVLLKFGNLENDLKNINTGIADIFRGLWNTIVGLWKAGVGFVEGFAKGLIDTVIGLFQGLYDRLVGHSIVPDMINSIISWFAQLPGRAMGAISAFPGQVGGFFGNVAAQAEHWGSEIISNVIAGIQSMVPNAQQAAANVAGAISSVLHHSKPDIGPLRDDDQWGADFMKNLIGGINSQKAALSATITSVAQHMVTVKSTGSQSFMTSSVLPLPNFTQAQPQIIVQPAPIYLDGRLLTNGLMPYIANAIRYGTGVHGM